jgi:hypothetical protein
MHPWRTALALVLVLVATASFADVVEYAGGQKIIGDGTLTTAYYAPAFTYSPDNTWAYLYVQGDHNTLDPSEHDSVYLYRNPNTWTGLTTQYSYVKRLLPDAAQGHPGSYFYGHPSVARADGKYYLSAVKAPDDATFHQQLWGVSPDGQTFTWYPLLHWKNADGTTRTNADKIPGISVQPVTIGGVNYFWGFSELWLSNGAIGVGAIRIRRANNAKGFDLVELRSGGIWRAVSADGSFSFTPDVLWVGATQPKLVWQNNAWTIYTTGSGARVPCSGGCPLPAGQNPNVGWGDRIWYRTVTTSLTFGAVNNVWSQIRCMPAPYNESRNYPYPVPGTNLIYSSTNDANCRSDYHGDYIVVTAVQ